MNLKLKTKFDKFSIRGLVYMTVSGALLAYELATTEKIKTLLVVGYSLIFVIGLISLLFIKEMD